MLLVVQKDVIPVSHFREKLNAELHLTLNFRPSFDTRLNSIVSYLSGCIYPQRVATINIYQICRMKFSGVSCQDTNVLLMTFWCPLFCGCAVRRSAQANSERLRSLSRAVIKPRTHAGHTRLPDVQTQLQGFKRAQAGNYRDAFSGTTTPEHTTVKVQLKQCLYSFI